MDFNDSALPCVPYPFDAYPLPPQSWRDPLDLLRQVRSVAGPVRAVDSVKGVEVLEKLKARACPRRGLNGRPTLALSP